MKGVPGEKELGKDLLGLHSSLRGGDSRGELGSGNREQGQEERERPQGKVLVEYWENSFLELAVQPWHVGSGQCWSPHSRRELKAMDVTLGDKVRGGLGRAGLDQGFFPPQ